MRGKLQAVICFGAAALAHPALAAAPPERMNYQGVLRDAASRPLDGSFDMVFRLIDAAGGTEILVDRHDGANRVTVNAGLFNVHLGGGVVSDGAGPGTYTALSHVFRSFGDVLLRVEVNGETLTPDVRIVSSGYALNATYLNGVFESQFLRSDENDTALGKLFFAGTPSGPGISQGSVFVSPTSAAPDSTLLGVAVNAAERFRIDAEGDASLAGGMTVGSSLFVGRTTPITGADSFGVRKVAGPNVYGGMYMETSDPASWPFYGYATNGTARAWHYVNGNTGSWNLHTGGEVRLTVLGDGALFTDGPIHNDHHAFYMNYDGNDIAQSIYFWEDGSPIGEYLQWDNAVQNDDTFVFSDDLHVVGSLTALSKNFVQNHPYDPGLEIAYTSLEGDEATVFTRGHGRLDNGVARIALGPTFALVANPDLGLSAHLTSRGAPAALYVESVTPTEIVVRGGDGAADVAFDFVVFGLRVGYESFPVLRARRGDAPLPPEERYEEELARGPGLRDATAVARYRRMTAEALGRESGELDASRALRRAIGVQTAERPRTAGAPEAERPPRAVVEERGAQAAEPPLPGVRVPVSAEVSTGDVLAFDPVQTGHFRPADKLADPAVAGIALEPSRPGTDGDLETLLAAGGLVLCRVDAGYGAIRAGDLLTASPTPGHAMRALEALPGTVVAKAAEPFDAGTGLIRVLIWPR